MVSKGAQLFREKAKQLSDRPTSVPVTVEGETRIVYDYDVVITSVMQGIFGVSLISHFVVQGVPFALHVDLVDIELHTDSSSGCMACRYCSALR